MKKFTTLKTLLVGLLACAATSVWGAEGDKIYSNDFSEKNQTDFATWIGTGKVPAGYGYTILGRNGAFSIETGALVHTAPNGKSKSNVYDGDFGTFTEAITTATASRNYVLSFDITLAITNHIACKSIFEISGEDKKTILCLFADHTRANSATGATSYGYIVGGNNAFATADPTFTAKTNTEGWIGDGTKHVIAENINGMTGSKTYHVVLDAQTAGMAKLTIKEGETTIVNGENVSISAQKGLKYIYLANYNSWENPSSQITIDNLSIVEGAPTVQATANYSVKYIANISGTETEIKAQETRSGYVGNTISLLDADKYDIVFNNVKYIYSSDNASSKTIADDNSTEVTVIFAEAPSYTYSVIDNLGNTLASGSTYKGNDVNFYVPYFVFKEGKFYHTPSLDKGSLSYAQGIIASISENTTINVTYTEEENTNVVFYSEAENLSGITPYEDNYTKIRMSNGKTGYYATQTAFTSLPAGYYTLTAASRSANTTFYAGSLGEGSELMTLSSSGAVVATTSNLFILTETTDIYTSVGGLSNYFDYVIIRKLPSTVTATIGANGFSTFASEYNVKLPSGVTAYTAQVSGNYVNFTEVESGEIPANKGVLLKGTTGEITLDVIATATALGSNDFKVNSSGATFDAAENTTYFAMVKDRNPLTFGTVNPATVAIPANKAYLAVPAAISIESGARLTAIFDGEATAIKTVENAKAGKTIYNLNGQRVNKAQKGLYIVNGKKTIVK